MNLYREFFSTLKEAVSEPFVLGYIGRKSFNNEKIEAKVVTDDDEKHPPEWTESGLTWRFVPEINMLTFWEAPSKNELQLVKNWLSKKNYHVNCMHIYGQSFNLKKYDPDTPEMQRKPLGTDESIKKSKKYCGILLDKQSQNKLKQLFSSLIPENWSIKCHHMTIDPFNECSDNVGKSVNLMLTHFGKNDKACAVKVVGYKGITNNAFPHVTVAVNEADGGKAKDSNTITEWTPISKHITLTGTIENLD
jgi:hypothetical protein